MKPMLLTAADLEVIAHLDGYELWIFRGVGKWDKFVFPVTQFTQARKEQALRGGMLYATGMMPSRGSDVHGLAGLPKDWSPPCRSS